MTDNEIIKALECCKKPLSENTCVECAFYKTGRCSINMLNATLDLINRQKAEIERLREEKDSKIVMCLAKDIKSAKFEAIKEFAKMLIDKSDNGIISISDIPDYVKEMTEEN